MRLTRRNKSKRNQAVQLNTTSLMDIFTILLLFLLVQFGEGGVALPTSDELELPVSSAKALPEATISLMVTEKGIFVDGTQVMTMDAAMAEEGVILQPLKAELVRLADRTKYLEKQNASVTFAGKVTVLGDRLIPFHLLKKIMGTCAQAEYPSISLAVFQQEESA